MNQDIQDITNKMAKNSITNELFNGELTYDSAIKLIRKRNKKYKAKFISETITPLGKAPTEEETFEYFIKIVPLVQGLLCTNDNEIIKKLKSLRISNSLKWFLSFEDLVTEINRLHKIADLDFEPLDILLISVLYTDQMIIKSLESDFGFVENYNNVPETNSSVVILKKSLKRKKYNSNKNHIGKSTEIDIAIDELVFKPAIAVFGEEKAVGVISKNSASNKSSFLDELAKEMKSSVLTDRRKHIELFPLLKLICKNHQLFSRAEYFKDKTIADEGDKKSDTLYATYMAGRVKKILYKK